MIRNITMLSSIAVLLALLGCASGGSDETRVEPERPNGVVSERVSTPAEIRGLEVGDEEPGVVLDVIADRTLVWTTYRDNAGNLVVELPNTVPSDSVGDLALMEGLLRGVDVELLEDADRPLTRLVVSTRDETEHALTTEGERLRLQLMPVGYDAPVTLAYEAPPTEEPLEPIAESPASETYGADDVAPTPPVTMAASEPVDTEVESTDILPPASPTVAASSPSLEPTPVGTADAPWVAPAPTGIAARSLSELDVDSSGDGTRVMIAGDGEFRYSTFQLENPARFVIDLEDVVNTSGRQSVAVSSSYVDQVRIGQFRPVPDAISRVVFDLQRPVTPSIERTATGLVVTFGTPAVAAPAADPPTTLLADVEETPSDDVDDAGEVFLPPGRTVDAEPMDVAEDTTPADEPAPLLASVDESVPVEQDADPVTVPVFEPTPEAAPTGEATAFAGQTAAPQAPPPAAPPVADFAPPATFSDVAAFESQQVQGVEPAAQEPVLPGFTAEIVTRSNREYVGQPITMSLKDADLVETLRSFSRISDLNFVIQPRVRGSVTVELENVPWDQALEQILKINNLGLDIDGTIVRIAPLQTLQEEAKARAEIAELRQKSVPLTTLMRSLSYAEAQAVAGLLRGGGGGTGILSSRGDVQVDRRTNTLIIRELPDYVDTVLAVVENLDTPEPQVRIEARIIEATKNFSRSLGVAWDFDGVSDEQFGNTTNLEFPNQGTANGGVALLSGGANGFLNISLGNVLNTFMLDAQLVAAENEGLINVISAPSITTLNNQSATIQSGLQIPIQTIANNTVSVQFVNATLQMTVTPQVTAEGTIIMNLNVAKKEPQLAFAIAGATNAPIANREARTTVIVRDGGTAVIGGIYEVTSNQNQDRVPGLANIPILGHLFKNRSRSNSNDELLIFVTPRIVPM
ncbi:MAG: type IV pilus secretin PilQ [Acidobacteriota bacterium]